MSSDPTLSIVNEVEPIPASNSRSGLIVRLSDGLNQVVSVDVSYLNFIADFSTFVLALRGGGVTNALDRARLEASWRETRDKLIEDVIASNIGPIA